MSSNRVVVFIDYENMLRCARRAFKGVHGHFSPWSLGEHLVSRRNQNDGVPPSHLHAVRVYRGLPSSYLEPESNARNQAQFAAWQRSGNVVVKSRPLRYPENWPYCPERPQEKGVDVELAVDLVQMTYQGGFSVGIVCSHDSDLLPGIQVAMSVFTSTVHLEVACWKGSGRIPAPAGKKLYCHRLDRGDFAAVEDATTYP